MSPRLLAAWMDSSLAVSPLASSVASRVGTRSKWSSSARLLRPVIIRTSLRPTLTASSTTYWMAGLSTTGSISLGMALVAGRNLVPSPAAGITALRTEQLVVVTVLIYPREHSYGKCFRQAARPPDAATKDDIHANRDHAVEGRDPFAAPADPGHDDSNRACNRRRRHRYPWPALGRGHRCGQAGHLHRLPRRRFRTADPSPAARAA